MFYTLYKRIGISLSENMLPVYAGNRVYVDEHTSVAIEPSYFEGVLDTSETELVLQQDIEDSLIPEEIFRTKLSQSFVVCLNTDDKEVKVSYNRETCCVKLTWIY